MSNSTSNLDLISPSQAGKETTANSLFDAASPAALFGRRASTTAALTWGYYGGVLNVSGTPTPIANGTVALTASATNYVEATTAGVVSANTTGFTAGRTALYTVITGAAAVTSYTDQRTTGTPETVTSIGALINGATAKTTPVDADQLGLMDSAAANVLKKLSWASLKATLKTYFDTLYGSGSGSVTSVSVTTANGVSGSVATPTTTPAISLTLGAITPTSVAASGSVTGSNLSGNNTGDQTLSDATLFTSDITTNNVSITKHGFAPKAPNDATMFLNGVGAYSVPAGGGSSIPDYVSYAFFGGL